MCRTRKEEYDDYLREYPFTPIESFLSTRKQTPVFKGVLSFFPDAIKEVSKVSYKATQQHHPDKEMHWDRDKSNDHLDALSRHLIDHSVSYYDEDDELHLSKSSLEGISCSSSSFRN